VFAALGTQHVIRKRHIAICGLTDCTAFCALYLIKGTILGGKKLVGIKYVVTFCTTFVCSVVCSKNIADRNDQNCIASSCKVPFFFFFSDINETF
jgi:hypothetical protein